MRWRLAVIVVGWLGLLAVGFGALQRFDSTPGSIAAAEPRPELRAETYRLVMFVHPHCPCGRAALDELKEIVRTAGPRLTVEVAFVGPPTDREVPESWAAAERIPGVTVRWADGREARAAGARTSGHVVLYDPTGAVRFRGGITISRGHRGPNPGRTAVQAALLDEVPQLSTAPVFGCPLEDSSEGEGPE
jgi:hypothetical protein